MPIETRYQNIFDVISTPRLSSYRAAFNPVSDKELYGIYLWSQHAAGSLFPLLQAVEITVRNSIDREARSRYGDFWWDSVPCRGNRNSTLFYRNIQKAKQKLNRDWDRKERLRLNLGRNTPLPNGNPNWSHDQIVAATDFCTWQFALAKEFSNPGNPEYLWPRSLGKCFKKFNLFHNDAHQARMRIIDMINELRVYRNRVFHHEPVWIKSRGVNTADIAIETIRKKINKMEKILMVTSPAKRNLLESAGVLSCARRVCSVEELYIYSEDIEERDLTKRQAKSLRKICANSKKKNKSSVWKRGEDVYTLSRLR